jgi:hypothetical protein
LHRRYQDKPVGQFHRKSLRFVLRRLSISSKRLADTTHHNDEPIFEIAATHRDAPPPFCLGLAPRTGAVAAILGKRASILKQLETIFRQD